MGSTTTERDLMIAKAKYHKLKHELFTEKIKLIDAKAGLNEARRFGLLGITDIEALEQAVADAEDRVTDAEASVAKASRAVGRLSSKRSHSASDLGFIALLEMVLNPGAGLVDVIHFDGGSAGFDRLTQKPRFGDTLLDISKRPRPSENNNTGRTGLWSEHSLR